MIEQISTGIVYIGQTRERFEKRYWHNHCVLVNNEHANTNLQEAFNEYGDDDFRFIVLKVCVSKDDLDKEETDFIAIARNGKGAFNISAGGAGRNSPLRAETRHKIGEANKLSLLGKKASAATKEKMRKSSKHASPTEEHRKILSEYMSSRTVSEETRKKVSAAFSGSKSRFAKIDESTARRTKQLIMSGETLKSVAETLSIGYGTVSAIANGYSWKCVDVEGWDSFFRQRKR